MNTQNFITEAENARVEFVAAKMALLDFMGSKRLSSLKKDPEFIRLTKKVKAAKKLWYDYNAAILIQAKSEMVQSILN